MNKPTPEQLPGLIESIVFGVGKVALNQAKSPEASTLDSDSILHLTATIGFLSGMSAFQTLRGLGLTDDEIMVAVETAARRMGIAKCPSVMLSVPIPPLPGPPSSRN